MYDLAVGSYDVVVTTGPSFLKRRTEAAEGAIQLVSNNPEHWAIIEDWLVSKTRAQAVALLGEHGVPSGPVFTAEDIFDDPHIAARHMLVTVDDPIAGPRRYARSPLHLSSAPEIPAAPAPRLGEHTRPILQDLLGYKEAEIEQLIAEGVVATQQAEEE